MFAKIFSMELETIDFLDVTTLPLIFMLNMNKYVN